MNHTEVDVQRVSQKRIETGCYPTRVVMWKQDSGYYATHLEVFPNDREDNKPYFIIGHYDMMKEANEDFGERCKQLSVVEERPQPTKTFGNRVFRLEEEGLTRVGAVNKAQAYRRNDTRNLTSHGKSNFRRPLYRIAPYKGMYAIFKYQRL